MFFAFLFRFFRFVVISSKTISCCSSFFFHIFSYAYLLLHSLKKVVRPILYHEFYQYYLVCPSKLNKFWLTFSLHVCECGCFVSILRDISVLAVLDIFEQFLTVAHYLASPLQNLWCVFLHITPHTFLLISLRYYY